MNEELPSADLRMPIDGRSLPIANRQSPIENASEWFFADEARVVFLLAAVARCIGTPWAKFGRVMGREGGCDCVFLPEYVLTAAGVAQGRAFSFLRTSADYQTARSYLRILHMLRGTHRQSGSDDPDPQAQALAEIFVEIPLPESKTNLDPALFMPGDLAICRDGGMFHFCVMTSGRDFVDCTKAKGVERGNIHDTTYSNYLVAHFRARNLNKENRK